MDVQTKDGRTALMAASQKGHEAVVKALLEKGASMDLQTKDGVTELTLASEKGHEAVVKALLEYSAKKQGMMMMTFIIRRGEGQGRTKKGRKATKSEGSGLEGQGRFIADRTSLVITTRLGHELVVKELTGKGGCMDLQEEGGRGTAMMAASRGAHGSVVKALLGLGASMDLQTKYGCDSADVCVQLRPCGCGRDAAGEGGEPGAFDGADDCKLPLS